MKKYRFFVSSEENKINAKIRIAKLVKKYVNKWNKKRLKKN